MQSAYEVGRALNPKPRRAAARRRRLDGHEPRPWETTEPYYPDRSHGPVDFNHYLMPGPGDIAPHRHLGARAPRPRWPVRRQGSGRDVREPGAAGDVANAVYDAVGVRIDDLPITPEKILRGIRANGGASPPAAGRRSR